MTSVKRNYRPIPREGERKAGRLNPRVKAALLEAFVNRPDVVAGLRAAGDVGFEAMDRAHAAQHDQKK